MIDVTSAKDLAVRFLREIDSATKYPSIPTYHDLGERGVLQETHVDFLGARTIYLTEKIDGTNFRIILLGEGKFLIGSRKELLCYCDDVVHNPTLGIVDNVRVIAEELANKYRGGLGCITVVFGELYGGGINKSAKQYTANQTQYGVRFYDAVQVNYADLARELEQISGWRERGGQFFFNKKTFDVFCSDMEIEQVPEIAVLAYLPLHPETTLDFMKSVIPESRAKLCDDAGGRPEGLVVRTADRGVIAKLRFEDYERTLRQRTKS